MNGPFIMRPTYQNVLNITEQYLCVLECFINFLNLLFFILYTEETLTCVMELVKLVFVTILDYNNCLNVSVLSRKVQRSAED